MHLQGEDWLVVSMVEQQNSYIEYIVVNSSLSTLVTYQQYVKYWQEYIVIGKVYWDPKVTFSQNLLLYSFC